MVALGSCNIQYFLSHESSLSHRYSHIYLTGKEAENHVERREPGGWLNPTVKVCDGDKME